MRKMMVDNDRRARAYRAAQVTKIAGALARLEPESREAKVALLLRLEQEGRRAAMPMTCGSAMVDKGEKR